MYAAWWYTGMEKFFVVRVGCGGETMDAALRRKWSASILTHIMLGDVSPLLITNMALHFPPPLSTPLFHSHCRSEVRQPCLQNSQSQYYVRDSAIHYWENKVVSVSSALGQQLKTSRQHRGTRGGVQTLSEPFHQILMHLIEVFRHYKASWRVYVFLWQSTVLV